MITISEADMEQKMNEIKDNMRRIKEGINDDRDPIFIELLGTPKSGKTTLLKNVKGLFANSGIEMFTRRETAEYNPVDKDSNQYDLWMVLELFRNLVEDISNRKGQIVIYDRGIIDRLTWLQSARLEGSIEDEDLNRLFELYKINSINSGYKPITLGFLTSPELSVQRKGKEGRVVNVQNLRRYNTILKGSQQLISQMSSSYKLTETDTYQGKLEEFILDMSSYITGQIANQLEIKKSEKVKNTTISEKTERE